MNRQYFQISEITARVAKTVNSFSEYKEGSATEEYKHYVDKVYDIVEKIAKEKPKYLEKAESMAGRYSKKLADYYNAYYRNEASCPSIMISGGGNFPVKKKMKQNSRRETLLNEWNYLQNYAEKIENILICQQPILSNDENAIELLQDKLDALVEEQNKMKDVNAYYRKNKTLDGCEAITPEEAVMIKKQMNTYLYETKPFSSWMLTNNNANIKRTRERLESLKKIKEEGNKETECKYFEIVENAETMRLQLIFDEKPEEKVREVLKSNGFKWAPSQGAWQRQLTSNARYSLKRVIKALDEMEGATV